MKLLKCITALALCAGLLFTGCGQGGGSGTSGGSGVQPMGRWVETKLDLSGLPAEIISVLGVKQTADGGYELLGSDRMTASLFTSADGASWQQKVLWPSDKTNYVVGAAQSAGGKTVLALMDTQQRTTSLVLLQNGQQTVLQNPWEGNAMPKILRFVDEDTLFVSYMLMDQENTYSSNGMSLVNVQEGNTLVSVQLPEEWYGEMTANAESLFAFSNKGVLTAYDRQGNIQSGLSSTVNSGSMGALTVGQTNDIYFTSETGLSRMAAGGTLVETVLEGGNFQFGRLDQYVSNIDLSENGDVLMTMQDTTSNRSDVLAHEVYRYHFDETLPAKNAKELTIWSLEESPTARAAVVAFSRQNPQVTVTYEPVVALGEAATAQQRVDAVTALNAALLAGSGPDILLLDGLDAQSYIQQGLLVDLSHIAAQSGLQTTVTGPLATDGKQYLLPARFTLPVLIGNSETLASLTSQEALTQQLLALPARPAGMNVASEEYYVHRATGEQYLMSFLDQQTLLDYLYPHYAGQLLQNGALNETILAELLEQMKIISDAYGLPAQSDMPNWSATGNLILKDNINEYGTGAMIGWCEFTSPEAAQYNSSTFTIEDLEAQKKAHKEVLAATRVIQQPGSEAGLYTPVCLAAVNAASPLPEEAKAFVAMLLGDEVQGVEFGDGLPVQQEALQNVLKAGAEKTPAAVQDIEGLVDSLKTPVLSDLTVKEKLAEPVFALCTGTITQQQALNQCVEALKLYLAEQK